MKTDSFPTLTTERLRLREMRKADAPALLALRSDPEVMQWCGDDSVVELAQAQRLIEVYAAWRRMSFPATQWALERREDGRLIGACALSNWRPVTRTCQISYELAREAWGCGYMQEALRAALAWGFPQMSLNRIEARIHPDNSRSRALARRLGFLPEGVLREAGFWGGSHHDMQQGSLLAREYRDMTTPEATAAEAPALESR
jgi:[ribosomal protein S5]-alanine N-acetyltransferase